LKEERALQAFLCAASDAGILKSAHDIAQGGVAVALAESCIAGNIGVELVGLVGTRVDAAFFGERSSAAIVTCAASHEDDLTRLARRFGVTHGRLGMVGGFNLRSGGIDISVGQLRDAYESGLPRALGAAALNV
jgi:phosphoribosylformylglycinamidine synthase